jgi:multidrug efflux pump subunit AcrB/putative flippase GtrA
MQRDPFHISSFSIIVAFVCLALVGLTLLPLLSIREAPSNKLPSLNVSFMMTGSSPRVVEQEVTDKLEETLTRLNGIQNVTSMSGSDGGTIQINFNKSTDMDMARLETSTAIRQIWRQLPKGISYPQIMIQKSDDDAYKPFMTYSVSADRNASDIQRYVNDSIAPRLGQMKGVYSVKSRGTGGRQYLLEYDKEQLHLLGLDIGDIQQAIDSRFSHSSIGLLPIEDSNGNRQWLRTTIAAGGTDTLDLSSITVKIASGRLIPISELVTVTVADKESDTSYRINGLQTLFLDITADEGANQLELSKRVTEHMSCLQKTLPPSYELSLENNSAKDVGKELNNVYVRSGLTVIILLLFIFAVARNIRIVSVICTSLVINIAVALVFYYLFGIEIHVYSLAGITISLNLIIDNIIVMSDHLKHRDNIRIFIPMLAATLTTIGALSIIFFLDEKTRLNLQDFAAVLVVNLTVSLAVALFFVPCMQIYVDRSTKHDGSLRLRLMPILPRLRFAVRFSHFYEKAITLLSRHKKLSFIVLILIFGLPVFLLPQSVQSEGLWGKIYNKTIGSDFYNDNMRSLVDRTLGGTFRLFMNGNGEEGLDEAQEDSVGTTFLVSTKMPNGSTMDMMEASLSKMEAFLSRHHEIRRFTTSINSSRDADIDVTLAKEANDQGLVLSMRDDIIQQALIIGGGSWSVNGPGNMEFTNGVTEPAGDYLAKIYGYNYDRLIAFADEFRDSLETFPRIQDIQIGTQRMMWKDDYAEYDLLIDNPLLASKGITVSDVYDALNQLFGKDTGDMDIMAGGRQVSIRFVPKQMKQYDRWALLNFPIQTKKGTVKLSDIATIRKKQMPPQIYRENQQYCIIVQFKYIGSEDAGQNRLEKEIVKLNKRLPMGYKATMQEYGTWDEEASNKYLLILLVVAIVFVITSILFNSLKQPFAIIMVIPVSFIGVFCIFGSSGIIFGEGGLAAMVLLCGITVNASIYLVNEYNCIRRKRRSISSAKVFTLAWNAKIIPITLTILSTILGFIPFMIGKGKDVFWYALSVGTTAGLIASFIGIFIFLPILIVRPSEKSKKRGKNNDSEIDKKCSKFINKSRILEIIRFGLVGTTAMVIHYAIYYFLLPFMIVNMAFSIGYLLSFICNFFMTSCFTFKVRPSFKRLCRFGISHGINYLLQIALLNAFLALGIGSRCAPIPVYAVSIPINFLLVRFAMLKRNKNNS